MKKETRYLVGLQGLNNDSSAAPYDDPVPPTSNASVCSLESGMLKKFKCHYDTNNAVKYGTWIAGAVGAIAVYKQLK